MWGDIAPIQRACADGWRRRYRWDWKTRGLSYHPLFLAFGRSIVDGAPLAGNIVISRLIHCHDRFGAVRDGGCMCVEIIRVRLCRR
jgi:hypothetical protein